VLRELRTRLVGISPVETSFAVRGFHAAVPEKVRALEGHGVAFVTGFNLALAARDGDEFADRALAVPAAERGFTYEGAGMALAVLDLLALGRGQRLAAFLGGTGAPHVYMVHVGAGWAVARLRRRLWGPLRGLDPLLRWLAADGYGFHQGFFFPGRFVRCGERPRGLTEYQLRVFDQGLGRSLWFVDGADVERIAATVSSFPVARHADLWSGVGLAAAYAGAVEKDELERLVQLLGSFRPHAAQGASFAATARLRAGNPVPHTTIACELLCGCGVDEAAAAVEAALVGIEPDGRGVSYELWRTRIREALTRPREVAA
jgi:hypothetical protein